MSRSALLAVVIFLALGLVPAGPARGETPELTGSWGWMWGGSADSRAGKLRLDDTMDLGGVLSFPAGHLNWIEAHYTFQGTAITLDGFGPYRPLTDLNVHHMQLVGLRALKDGPVVPFVVSGLGATLFDPAASFVDIDGTRYGLSNNWKFSLVLGVGAKIWLGEAQRVGLRLQFRTLPSIYSGSTGIWLGGGGGSISVSGTGIWQFDASAGISLKLGQPGRRG